MMRQFELVERVLQYDPNANEDLLNRAYIYAMQAHVNQKRASGDPYFSHPLEVAAILTDYRLDEATIVAALLHDVVEDTDATAKEVEELFGSEIASLVDGLTKIRRLDLITKEAAQAENLRKLLLAVAQDIRVLLIKLADRLHNMRTLEHMAPKKKRRIAQETLDIYAPLAGRMGMQSIRDELEDLAFRVLNPEAYHTITERLVRLRQESGNILDEIVEALRSRLFENKIEAQVSGREKRPYSIWQKMEKKQLSLGQLSDIYGFRVLVSTVDKCYRTLGIAHRTWRTVPGRFKDYISNPKQNDYRSLHTTVIGPHHMRAELQIRTFAMHEIAERGIAAHSAYKEFSAKTVSNPQKNGIDTNNYGWLRHLIDTLSEGVTPKEFLEHTRLELFSDQVFCFTPKGDLIALPRGANVIDFAYALHTDIGNSCVGCEINGRSMPLITELQNGDEVSIVRSQARVPPSAWEGLAMTGKARAAIRRATRNAIRAQYAALGKEMLERLLAHYGHGYSPKELTLAFPKLGVKNSEDGLAALGRGEIDSQDVLQALGIAVDEKERKTLRSIWRRSLKNERRTLVFRGTNSDFPTKISELTGAVPGERIVGILTQGEGITVYPVFSRALASFEGDPERWIDMIWDVSETFEKFPARLKIIIQNKVGALAQLTHVIEEYDANIESMQMLPCGSDCFDVDILVAIENSHKLQNLLHALKNQSLISSAFRFIG